MSERQVNKERMNVLIGCGFLLTMVVVIGAIIGLFVKEAVDHGWMYSASIALTVAVICGVLYWLLEVWAFGGDDG